MMELIPMLRYRPYVRRLSPWDRVAPWSWLQELENDGDELMDADFHGYLIPVDAHGSCRRSRRPRRRLERSHSANGGTSTCCRPASKHATGRTGHEDSSPFLELINLMFGSEHEHEAKDKQIMHKSDDKKPVAKPEWKKILALDGFSFQDANVKTTENHHILVEAKKDSDMETEDCDCVYFSRQLRVPPGVDLDTLKVFFSDDSKMSLSAQWRTDTTASGGEESPKIQASGEEEAKNQKTEAARKEGNQDFEMEATSEEPESAVSKSQQQSSEAKSQESTSDNARSQETTDDYCLAPETKVDPAGQVAETQLEKEKVAGVALTRPEFSMKIDLRDLPEECVQVKVDGRTLTVNARHEEKTDEYSLTRVFQRSVTLPEGVDPAKVKSKFNEFGQLVISEENEQ